MTYQEPKGQWKITTMATDSETGKTKTEVRMCTPEENAALDEQARNRVKLSKLTFFNRVKRFEELKAQLKEAKQELEDSLYEFSLNSYLQDPTTSVVYKIIRPEGTFVEFPEIGYKRTALEGECGGTVLSKKEAEEAGFVLKRA